MKISLSSIASSSKGNCYIISAGSTVIMSDCGISIKKIEEGLSLLALPRPDALLLTHSHVDHIKSAKAVIKRFSLPTYITEQTFFEGGFPTREGFKTIVPGTPFTVGSIGITPFSLYHDAAAVGFIFETDDDKAALITDTGIVTEEMLSLVYGASSVIIEANHDTSMVMNGSYPEFLKKRILGGHGHLSNDDCAEACRCLLRHGTRSFLLAHLSQNNNTPEAAFTCVDSLLKESGGSYTLKTAYAAAPCTL